MKSTRRIQDLPTDRPFLPLFGRSDGKKIFPRQRGGRKAGERRKVKSKKSGASGKRPTGRGQKSEPGRDSPDIGAGVCAGNYNRVLEPEVAAGSCGRVLRPGIAAGVAAGDCGRVLRPGVTTVSCGRMLRPGVTAGCCGRMLRPEVAAGGYGRGLRPGVAAGSYGWEVLRPMIRAG